MEFLLQLFSELISGNEELELNDTSEIVLTDAMNDDTADDFFSMLQFH